MDGPVRDKNAHQRYGIIGTTETNCLSLIVLSLRVPRLLFRKPCALKCYIKCMLVTWAKRNARKELGR